MTSYVTLMELRSMDHHYHIIITYMTVSELIKTISLELKRIELKQHKPYTKHSTSGHENIFCL